MCIRDRLTLTVGGVTFGNWEMGSIPTAVNPNTTIKIAITPAKMGRLIK